MNLPVVFEVSKRMIVSISLSLVILGCAHMEYPSHMDLRYGLNKQEVLTTMGPPAAVERYKKADETIVEYLLYNNFVAYEERTPICFINNKLVGWGRTFYLDHVSDRDIRLK
ncbi:MAG: DUF3192 domain-containing protein [Candidatus Omnitrophica bacterium]|nr:DUF3192 domain-containing protein [Candidatus Omnitrophota bacterium]